MMLIGILFVAILILLNASLKLTIGAPLALTLFGITMSIIGALFRD